MSRRVHTYWAVLTCLALIAPGCRPAQPFFLHEDGDLSHFIDKATELEYPDVCTTTLADVENSHEPFTLLHDKGYEFWDRSLDEVIKITMCNTKIARTLSGRFITSAFNNRAQTGDAPDFLLRQPDASRSVYDAAIAESAPFTGVEYALSAFDTQLTSNLFWQKNDRQQNILPRPPIDQFFVQVFRQDLSTFNAQLQKISAQGGIFTVRNNITYDQNNNPTRLVPSDWNVNYEMSFNQPLLQGAGAQYNRIAGPYNPFQTIPGGVPLTPTFDGVLLARINVDVSLADFEAGVRDLVADVEQAYWELYFAYRNLEAMKIGRESALTTWKKIHALYVVSTTGGEAEKEAQAREQYFLFQGQVQTAFNDLLRAESRLRYIMGISPTDGRLIRPSDEPTTAKVEFEWCEALQESLARTAELRRQKWRIKQRELEVIAARNLLLPRLDAAGTYRWLGLGDQLLGHGPSFNPSDPFGLIDTSAYQVLGSGQFQEWALGIQAHMSIGFRKEHAMLRFYELNLARERARLQDQELEVAHDMTDAIRQLDFNYTMAITNLNRAVAAQAQVDAVDAAYEAQTVTLDLLLEAQRRLAEAKIAFFRTLVDYNRGIMFVHRQKGSLLEYDGIFLTEGPWPAKAQFDAHRRARQRDASHYLNYGFTRPRVMSQGPIEQCVGDLSNGGDGYPQQPAYQGGVTPEEVQTPTPVREVPSSDEGLPPDFASPTTMNSHQPPAESRTASAEQAFEWGTLGLATPSTRTKAATAAAPTTQIADTNRPYEPRRGATRDASVQQASFNAWKPTEQESATRSAPGSPHWSASGWQGTRQ